MVRNIPQNPPHGQSRRAAGGLSGTILELIEHDGDRSLTHEEHLLNEYIMTAMADYGPGIVVGKSAS